MSAYPQFADILEIGCKANGFNGGNNKLCHNYTNLIPKPLQDEVKIKKHNKEP